MKDLFIDDYELVGRTEEDGNAACGGCSFEFKDCRKPSVLQDSCTKRGNLHKVWKLKQQQNEKNN